MCELPQSKNILLMNELYMEGIVNNARIVCNNERVRICKSSSHCHWKENVNAAVVDSASGGDVAVRSIEISVCCVDSCMSVWVAGSLISALD